MMEGEDGINTKRRTAEDLNAASVVVVDNNTAGSDSTKMCLSPPEEDGGTVTGSLTLDQTRLQQLQSSVETTGQPQQEDIVSSNHDENVSSEKNQLDSERLVKSSITEDKEENTTMSPTATAGGDDSQQDDGLCPKGYRTLTGVVTLEQTILCQSSVETAGQLSTQEAIMSPIDDDDVSSENQLNSEKRIMAGKENTTVPSTAIDGDDAPQGDGICLNDSRTISGSVTLELAISCQSSVETTVQLSMQEVIVSSNDEDVSSENQLNSEQLENTSLPSTTTDSDAAQKADGLRLKDFQTLSGPVNPDQTVPCQSSVETTGQLPMQGVIMSSNDEDVVSSENRLNSEQLISRSIMEDKENSVPSTSTTTAGDDVQQNESPCPKAPEVPVVTPTKHGGDAEMVKRAQEEGCVRVVFPGTVTQEGCRRFVHEILKCILYQRQQLPMTYDQLKHSQRSQASKQNKEVASWRPVHSADMGWRKTERSLQELDLLLEQLEVLFSLSLVPRVLLLLGGSVVLPKELYEINMEALVLSPGDKSLRVSSCLRQLFHALFVTDLLSDTAPVRLMATTVLVLAHRECGVGWFRPKLGFKMPTRVKRHIIVLSTDTCRDVQTERADWKEYVWFQAPVAIKGFNS